MKATTTLTIDADPHAETIAAANKDIAGKQYRQAIQRLSPVVRQLDPKSPEPRLIFALLLMADAQRFAGLAEDAYRNYVVASELDPGQSARLEPHLMHCLSEMQKPLGLSVFEADVIKYLENRKFDNNAIDRLCREALIQKYKLDQDDAEIDFSQLIQDPFLLATIKHLVLADPLAEKFLTTLRQEVFNLAIEHNLPDLLQPIVLALAEHAELVEYAFPLSEDESVVLLGIRTLLETELRQADDLKTHLGPLLLYAMYEPVINLRFFADLSQVALNSLPEPCRPLFKRLFLDPERERVLAEALPALKPVSNRVSIEVMQQYEQNPYPRWHDIFIPEQKIPYLDVYPNVKAVVDRNGDYPQPVSCLVAGSGTGKQPLWIAANCKDMSVTAVDLSLPSLGYAQRQALELGLTVNFYHGDILDLSALPYRFDVIECSGVLHHMQEPEEGLVALVKHLNPMGILRLGLYSRIARNHAGVNLAKRNPELANLEMIRDTRKTHLNNLSSVAFQTRDFFTTSECRDLLFHVQEHQFDLLDVKALLKRHNLRFLGFNRLPEPLSNAYREAYPDDEQMVNLKYWHDFEQAHPQIFIGMYQFHCQKND